MHPSALLSARRFFSTYLPLSVLEVGSLEVCGGQMRDVCHPSCQYYLGVDLVAGPGVDEVLDDPYFIPYIDHFAAVVSTSTFEHCEFFWTLFLEMVKATSPGGHIYINAPSNGPVHRHPADCWRFYPDAGPALTRWAKLYNMEVEVVETAISPPDPDDPARWEDWWCVWRRIA